MFTFIFLLLTGITQPQKEASIQTERLWVVYYVNQERAKRGLNKLEIDETIDNGAQSHSEYMARTGRFHHASFANMYPATGENIAYGQRNPKEVMNSWMNSPGHRNNMLGRRYTKIGVGLAINKNGTKYWTQRFR